MPVLAQIKILVFALVFLVLTLLSQISVVCAQSAFQYSGATVPLAVTGTTARVAIAASSSFNNSVRVYNSGSVAVFIACGDVTVVATTAAGLPIAPGTVEILGCQGGYVAGISGGTAATIYLTAGAGL